MRWFFLLLGIIAKADQTEWVRELETGGVSDPDACLHTSRGFVIARGAYGLSKDAWGEVSVMPWTDAHYPEVARRACARYLELTYIRLQSKLGRKLTFADVYAGYRFGVTGYLKMGGRISQTPPSFRKKMEEYHVPYQRLTNFR
jgi:hypothetical protein